MLRVSVEETHWPVLSASEVWGKSRTCNRIEERITWEILRTLACRLQGLIIQEMTDERGILSLLLLFFINLLSLYVCCKTWCYSSSWSPDTSLDHERNCFRLSNCMPKTTKLLCLPKKSSWLHSRFFFLGSWCSLAIQSPCKTSCQTWQGLYWRDVHFNLFHWQDHEEGTWFLIFVIVKRIKFIIRTQTDFTDKFNIIFSVRLLFIRLCSNSSLEVLFGSIFGGRSRVCQCTRSRLRLRWQVNMTLEFTWKFTRHFKHDVFPRMRRISNRDRKGSLLFHAFLVTFFVHILKYLRWFHEKTEVYILVEMKEMMLWE